MDAELIKIIEDWSDALYPPNVGIYEWDQLGKVKREFTFTQLVVLTAEMRGVVAGLKALALYKESIKNSGKEVG